MPVLNYIDSFDIKVNVAAGNVRIKIYSDGANKPDLLLGESDSIPITKTGVVNLRLIKQVEVPIDGQVWIALENDNASLDVDLSLSQASGTLYTEAHTFGVGPSPWFGGTADTSPFCAQIHLDPKVVKHKGVRGKQIEDFYAVVSAGEMTVESMTNRGSNNIFVTHIDLSYRGEDFQDGLTKMLTKASEIYDLIHMTDLNGQVQYAKVEIFPDEIIEGENLYLVGTRIQVTSSKVVMQI